MGILDNLGWGNNKAGNPVQATVIPYIFPLSIAEAAFILSDVQNIFSRILTDVLERTLGLKEKYQPLLWDNCVASEKSKGLVSLLSKAMVNQTELFLVYDAATNLVVEATPDQKAKIKAEYAKGKPTTGIYITFQNYQLTEMLKLYSALEYATVGGLYKNLKLAQAIQFKINDLRASVASIDSTDVTTQANDIVKALGEGRDVMLDGKDVIETATPDLTPTDRAMILINQKLSKYLGLPASWVMGVGATGLGDKGTADTKAVERGLKIYFFSIIKPVLENLFPETSVSFKSNDFEQIESANATLTTFDATSDEFLSSANKLLVINRLYGFKDEEKGGAVAPPVVPPKAPAG